MISFPEWIHIWLMQVCFQNIKFIFFLFWRVPIIIQLSKLNPGNKSNPGNEHVFHSHKSIEFPMIHVHVQVWSTARVCCSSLSEFLKNVISFAEWIHIWLLQVCFQQIKFIFFEFSNKLVEYLFWNHKQINKTFNTFFICWVLLFFVLKIIVKMHFL